MEHSFNTEVATLYGVNVALLLQHFKFWTTNNLAHKKHIHDGLCWTYASLDAFTKIFPYWSIQNIRTALSKCLENGLIVKGNYNKVGYDRTCWYALTPKAYAHFTDLLRKDLIDPICYNPQIDLLISTNRNVEINTPIPDTKTDTKTDNNIVRLSDESVLEVKLSPPKKVVTADNYRTHPMYELYRTFYNQYPKHEQPYPGFRAFMKLKPTEDLIEKIILDVQKRFKDAADKQFIPLPATYLNGRHWEGEITTQGTYRNAFSGAQERAKNQQMIKVREDAAAREKRAEMSRLRAMKEVVANAVTEDQRNYGIQQIRAIKDILATR